MKHTSAAVLAGALLFASSNLVLAQDTPKQYLHVDTLQQAAVFYVDDSKHGPVALDFSRFYTDHAWMLAITKPQSMTKDALQGYATDSLKTLQEPTSLTPTTMSLNSGTSYVVCNYPISEGSNSMAMLASPPGYYIKEAL